MSAPIRVELRGGNPALLFAPCTVLRSASSDDVERLYVAGDDESIGGLASCRMFAHPPFRKRYRGSREHLLVVEIDGRERLALRGDLRCSEPGVIDAAVEAVSR